MGLTMPKFVHLPLILNPTGGKLSKRNPYTSVETYIEKDFIPEAVVNYVGLMGWMPSFETEEKKIVREYKDELLSMREMELMFDLEKIHDTNAKLDEKKLLFFNGFYLRKKLAPIDNVTPEETEFTPEIQSLVSWINKQFVKHTKIQTEKIEQIPLDKWVAIIKLFKNRVRSFDELENYTFFFTEPNFTSEKAEKSMARVFKDTGKSADILTDVANILEKEIPEDDFTSHKIVELLANYLQANKDKIKSEDVYHLLRFVITGSHEGIPASDVCQILGKDTTLKRIRQWI